MRIWSIHGHNDGFEILVSTYSAENLRNFREFWNAKNSANMKYDAEGGTVYSNAFETVTATTTEHFLIALFKQCFRYLSLERPRAQRFSKPPSVEAVFAIGR